MNKVTMDYNKMQKVDRNCTNTFTNNLLFKNCFEHRWLVHSSYSLWNPPRWLAPSWALVRRCAPKSRSWSKTSTRSECMGRIWICELKRKDSDFFDHSQKLKLTWMSAQQWTIQTAQNAEGRCIQALGSAHFGNTWRSTPSKFVSF